MTTETLLEVDDVAVDYGGPRPVRALDGATLRLRAGERVALVGESGSGKSTLGSLVGRLLPAAAQVLGGRVEVAGADVLALSRAELRDLRRSTLGFVPQDPTGSLDPTMRIGAQLRLAVAPSGHPADRTTLTELLASVRLSDPERVLRSYPHQISGGMAQRVVIAMTMARRPRLLIADEPTAALDAQVREEVLRVLFELADQQETAVLWLSHDLRAVRRWCDRLAVMYAGRVVEDAPADGALAAPVHPYTAALAAAAPAGVAPGELRPIPGSPPVLTEPAVGCAFQPRCPAATAVCDRDRPAPREVRDAVVLCHHPQPVEAAKEAAS